MSPTAKNLELKDLYELFKLELTGLDSEAIENELRTRVFDVGSAQVVDSVGIYDAINRLSSTINEQVEAINKVRSALLTPGVLTGLKISVTANNQVKVTAGTGINVLKEFVELSVDKEFQVPLPTDPGILFILLEDGDLIRTGAEEVDSAVTIGKIIIQTSYSDVLTDDKENEIDGYLVSSYEETFYNTFDVEDNSIGELKNAMQRVLAGNLIGEINLSENLTIANNRGTMSADSENITFYNNDGEEIAKYGGYEARVGDIIVEPDRLRSRNYTQDVAGFEINKNGTAEFQEGNIGNIILDNEGLHSQNYSAGTAGFNLVAQDGSAEFQEGTIGNIVLDNLGLRSTNYVVGTSGFIINQDGSVEFQDAIMNGSIIAQTGAIGGWKITATTIYSDTAGDDIILDSANTTIKSSNYISGSAGSGFSLSPGLLEVGNIAARGIIRTAVFQKDIVSAIGTEMLSLPADTLSEDMTSLDSSSLVTEGNSLFAVGDILRIKDGADEEWFEVTAMPATPDGSYTVTRDKDNQYTADNNPAWKSGASVVNYRQSGDGAVAIVGDGIGAPYISTFEHTGSPWDEIETKFRLGNLNGYLDYSSDIYGVAFGGYDGSATPTDNINLTLDATNGLRIRNNDEVIFEADATGAATMTAANVRSSATGARVEILPDANTGIQVIDGSSNEVFKALIGGTDIGDVEIGDYSTSGGVLWDNSAAGLKIRGDITIGSSDTLQYDSFQKRYLTVNSGSIVPDGAFHSGWPSGLLPSLSGVTTPSNFPTPYTSRVYFLMPVNLPQSCYVKYIKAYWYLAAGSGTGTCLYRSQKTDGTTTTIATCPTNGTSGRYSVQDNIITGGGINNTDYTYYLQCSIQNSGGSSDRLYLTKVEIEYEVIYPLP